MFEADGSSQLVSNEKVLGQSIPYNGEFGISKNPESFVQYGFRSYFTDKNRGVVLRLSGNGLEQISQYGMGDFFSDNLAVNNNLLGSFDGSKGIYNLTLNKLTDEWQAKLPRSASNTTVSFKESVNGWSSRKSYVPESAQSLNNKYYTFKKGRVWEHEANSLYNNFYGVQYVSALSAVIADAPGVVKGFKTLGYTGTSAKEFSYLVNGYGTQKFSIAQINADNLTPVSQSKKEGWFAESVKTDLQEGSVDYFLKKEGKWFNNIKGKETFFTSNTDNNVDTSEFTVQGIGKPSSINVGATTAFNVHVFVDSSCSTETQPNDDATPAFNVHVLVDSSCPTEPEI